MKKVTRMPLPPWHKLGATAHLLQILSPRDAECSWQLCTPRRQRGGRDRPGTPAAQGHQARVLNLKLGHPPALLARLPVLPSLSPDFQPLEPFPSISPHTYPLPLPPPRTQLPTRPGPDTVRQRGQPRCRTSGRFLLMGPTSPRAATRTRSEPSPDARPNHVPRLRAPRRHRTHRASRATTPRSCRPPTALAPSHRRRAQEEPGADGKGGGKRRGRGPGGVRKGRGGARQGGKQRGGASAA